MSLLTGLVGHWKLDDGSGVTAVDSSGNGYDGTLTGTTAPAWGTQDGFACVDFSASGNGRIALPTAVYTDIMGGGAVTYAAWVRPAALTNAYAAIVAVQNNTGFATETGLYVKSDGKLRWYCAISGLPVNQYDGGTFTLNTDTWYFLSATCGASTAAGYVNADVDGTISPGTINDYSPTVCTAAIGNHPNANQGFAGAVRDVRIYSRALSETEILMLYQGDRAGFFNVEW